MAFSFSGLLSAVVGAVAKVATAVVNKLSPVAKSGGILGGIAGAVLGAAIVIANVCEDGEISEDEEELLEDAFKLLVGAFMGMFGSGSSQCNLGEEKYTIFDLVGVAVSKSWNSIKEIGHDFWSEADSRGQKAFNSGYDFANWLGCGVPDIVKETKGSVPKKSGVGVPEEFGGINKGGSNPTIRTGEYNSGINSTGSGLGKLANKELNVSEKGLNIVKNHINQFETYQPNVDMINRLENAMKNSEKITRADASFYMHELAESHMMKDLTKTMDFESAYDIAHSSALSKYEVSQFSVYHPEVIANNSSQFSLAWKRFWEGNK
ncbi:hypothetical protein [Clostridium sp. ZBS13]|uniref:hypothetical protein n=1 Tax=Clostridium sp. ZBS13 TaxID=2949971 RepID=UPI00207AEA34|nr:hypothetical protein [Clostridium sp. ZBS13]